MIQDSYFEPHQSSSAPSLPAAHRGPQQQHRRRKRSRSSRGRLSPCFHRLHQFSLESIPEDLCKDVFADDHHYTEEDADDPTATTTAPLDWVNRERARRHLPAFRHSPELERRAARHCRNMAECCTVFHSVASIDELVRALRAPHAAESIQRGDSVRAMHAETVQHRRSVNYCNLVSTVFTEFGAATCRGADGKLYQCQLFRN